VDTPDEPFDNFGKQVFDGAIGESEESVTEPEEYSEDEYTDDYEETGDEYDEYEDESYSESEGEESEKESVDHAKAQKVEEPSKIVKAKVLKKVDEKSNSAGATGRS